MKRARLNLHTAVFLFGFTAPLGELIPMNEVHIVWYRMGMCTLIFLGYFAIRRTNLAVTRKQLNILGLNGLILAVHWITFYGAIKLDGSEIALVLFSLGPMFTALLEPLYFKRKLQPYEFLVSGIAVLGIWLIMQASASSLAGIILGLIAALLNAFYSIYSKIIVEEVKEDVVNFYTIGLGFLILTMAMPLVPYTYTGIPAFALPTSMSDWVLLLILSAICTNLAYVMCLKGIKGLSPFNFMLVINLEPIYGILITFILLARDEIPGPYFWLGSAIVLGSVFANIWFQRKLRPA